MPRLKVDWMQIICTRKVFETWTCKAYLGIWGKKQVIFYKIGEVPRRRGFVTTGLTEGGVWMFARVCQMIVDAPGGWHTVAHGGTLWHRVWHTLCLTHITGGPAPRTIAASNNVLIAQFIYCNMYASYICACSRYITGTPQIFATFMITILKKKMYFEKPSRNGILLHLNWNRQLS